MLGLDEKNNMPQLPVDQTTWDREFLAGEWDYLDTNDLERARHQVIAYFIDAYNPKGKILDVGCGLGTTTDFLKSAQKKNYLGIDISTVAIKRALKKKAKFKSIDFLKFKSGTKFDVIIFNEVLYYLDEKEALTHALKLLKKNGVVIISLYRTSKKHYDEKIWQVFKKFFTEIDGTEISGHIKNQDVTWRISVLRKR